VFLASKFTGINQRRTKYL